MEKILQLPVIYEKAYRETEEEEDAE